MCVCMCMCVCVCVRSWWRQWWWDKGVGHTSDIFRTKVNGERKGGVTDLYIYVCVEGEGYRGGRARRNEKQTLHTNTFIYVCSDEDRIGGGERVEKKYNRRNIMHYTCVRVCVGVRVC